MYYEINEEQAAAAKSMYSFRQYKTGTETEKYKLCVDEAYKLAKEAPEHEKERALYLADLYAKKLAANINKSFEIEQRCPSVMISGGSNFPNKKKEKQNNARRKNFAEADHIQEYLEKIDNLKYTEKRIKQESKSTQNNFFTVVENFEMDRLQLVFEEKPAEEIRKIIKSNGFIWSPRNKTWQRQLTDNARKSANKIEKELSEWN